MTNAQTLLFMDWNSGTAAQATIGPNATSTSGSAISDAGGTGGTNGLNPGLPKADLDLVFTGSPIFDVAGIDIQFDFQRDESVGDFVTRNGFALSMNGGNLRVSFRVDNGSGGYNTVSSGNVYSIPNDNTFRTYRFFYLPDMGTAELQVNGAVVWSYTGTPGRDMVWSGGDLMIGNSMDGSGSNRTIFDNFVIGSVSSSPLPVELTRFEGQQQANQIVLNWTTASETNNHYFTIERSIDGIHFDEKIAFVEGMGNSSNTVEYSCVDENPVPGHAYYRISQTDFDGVTEQFDPIVVHYGNVDQLVQHTPRAQT